MDDNDIIVIHFGTDRLSVRYGGTEYDEACPYHRYVYTITTDSWMASGTLDMPPGYPFSLEDAARSVCAHLYFDQILWEEKIAKWIEQHREDLGKQTIY